MSRIASPSRRRPISVIHNVVTCALMLFAGITEARADRLDREVSFQIAAQPLATALVQFSKQAEMQIVTASVELGAQETHGISGRLTLRRALEELLARTGLAYSLVGENTVAIAVPGETAQLYRTTPDQDGRVSQTSSSALRLAQAEPSQSGAETSSGKDENTTSDDSEETAGKLEEIVVTAQKREERLLDVPISMSAYDAAAMDRRGIRDISDIAAITPGLDFGSIGLIQTVTMRGITTAGALGAQTTALFINDMPIQSRRGFGTLSSAQPQVFDLERVEVLRGPQGTLFGGSAMGGAVRFITPEPSLTDYQGYARTEIGTTRGGAISHEAGVAVGGPIIQDKLGFRVSGWHRRDGGYVDYESRLPGGIHEKNADNSDTYVARAALAFAPTDNLTFTPSIYVQDYKKSGLSAFFPSLSDPDDDRFMVADLLREPINEKFYLPALKVEADFAGMTFTSVTSYLYREHESHVDYTDLIPVIFAKPLPTSADFYEDTGVFSKQNSFTQELRLASADPDSRLQWTVGAFYSVARVDGTQTIEAPAFAQYILENFGVPIEAIFGGGLVDNKYSFVGNQRFRDEELAGFTNVEYELFSGVSAVAGVRVSRLKNTDFLRGEGPLYGVLTIHEGRQEETAVTPKFGINYKLNQNNLFYASVAKGYRPGGSNIPIPLADAPDCAAAIAELGTSPKTYESDTIWSYELGSKNALLGGRLRIDASIYRIGWSDIQQGIALPPCGFGLTTNFGEAKSEGFDLAFAAKVTDKLTADVSVGYTSATFTETTSIAGVTYARKGEEIAPWGVGDATAPWNITAALRYDFDLSSMVDGYVRVENRYKSRNDGLFSYQNPDNATYSPSFFVNEARNELNVRAGLMWGNFEVSAFATNVLNAHPLHNAQLEPYTYSGAFTLRPLTVGLTGVYQFSGK